MANMTTEACSKIIKAASALFSINGYHSVSMDRIAQASGVAKGTLYYHFKGKEDLYFVILTGGLDRMIADLEAIVAMPGPAPERLRRLVGRIVAFFWGNREFFRILIEQERLVDGHYFARLKSQRESLHGFLRQTIEGGIAEGVFRDVSAFDAATALQGMVRTLVMDRMERGAAEPMHEMALDVFLHGIAENGSRSRNDA